MITNRVRMASGRKDSIKFPPFIYHEGFEGMPLIVRNGRGTYQVNRQDNFINIVTNIGGSSTSNYVYLITQVPIDHTPYNSIRIIYYPRIKPPSISRMALMSSEVSYDGMDIMEGTTLEVNTINTVHTLYHNISSINGLRYLKLYFMSNRNGVNLDIMSIELIE